MNMISKTNKKQLYTAAGLAFGLILFTTLQVMAQGGPGNGGPTPTNVPIDGGASLLVAGGIAFGLKKLRDRKRR
jgi:hypothetical protein